VGELIAEDIIVGEVFIDPIMDMAAPEVHFSFLEILVEEVLVQEEGLEADHTDLGSEYTTGKNIDDFIISACFPDSNLCYCLRTNNKYSSILSVGRFYLSVFYYNRVLYVLHGHRRLPFGVYKRKAL